MVHLVAIRDSRGLDDAWGFEIAAGVGVRSIGMLACLKCSDLFVDGPVVVDILN